jgi:NAD(P)-dependent dehydrogenase (short-subunit alcohol dehydrogenase family)
MVYNVTKAGLLMLARTGAQALAARGVRVNTVSPGWTWSRNIESRYGTRRRADAFAAEFQPLGRMADPEEIADAVMFVVSDQAGFMTGSDLAIDGGYTALGPEALGQASKKVPPIQPGSPSR